MKDYDDIQDDEIRLITPKGGKKLNVFKKWWFWVAISLCVVIAIVLIFMYINRDNSIPDQPITPVPASPNIVEDKSSCVTASDTIVNDVALRLYIPQNATPELCIGFVDTADSEIVMAFQAADIREDNKQILGDFVFEGKLLASGKSKKAFCAIIDGKTYIDNSEESSLMDETIAKQGYFFRQYPLVINGAMQENKPKGKSVRHALCEKDGIIMAISTISRESFHDFAQALSDFGVQQAIYLTGGNAYGFCRTETETFSWGERSKYDEYMDAVNFIVWKSVK